MRSGQPQHQAQKCVRGHESLDVVGLSTYTKIFLYPTLEFAQCRMLWDDDLLRPEARHKNGLRANATEVGVQRRCDSSKG